MPRRSSDDYAAFYDEALSEPMPWFHMDTDFMDDSKVVRLAYEGGYRYVGMYVALMALLYRRDTHLVDVSDEFGWLYLQDRLSIVGHPIARDEMERFVTVLASLGLVDRELYAESRKVASDRVIREVENYAKTAARGRNQTKIMRERKEGKGKP